LRSSGRIGHKILELWSWYTIDERLEPVSLLSISCLLFLHNIFNILCIISRSLASVSARHSHGVLHHFLASNIPDAAYVVWKILFLARYCLLSPFSRHLWKLILSVHLLSIEVHFQEILLSIIHTETPVWLECNFPLLQVSLKYGPEEGSEVGT
jgi:hypothetical protein